MTDIVCACGTVICKNFSQAMSCDANTKLPDVVFTCPSCGEKIAGESPALIYQSKFRGFRYCFNSIKTLVDRAHRNAVNKGFYREPYEHEKEEHPKKVHISGSAAACLALIHSEVSEALEALRKQNSDNFEEELVDILIRVFDLAGWYELDLENRIIEKMILNESRPPKHGKAF